MCLFYLQFMMAVCSLGPSAEAENKVDRVEVEISLRMDNASFRAE